MLLDTAVIGEHEQTIRATYDPLARSGEKSLDAQDRSFDVGATKLLHFLAPNFFIMLDSRVAMAFREHHGVGFRKNAPYGYSASRYVTCLRCAQEEIQAYGPDRLRQLAPDTPLPRVIDKVAWVIGGDIRVDNNAGRDGDRPLQTEQITATTNDQRPTTQTAPRAGLCATITPASAAGGR
jgi:hypothetical protein